MPLLCGELASLISTAAKRSCVACNAVTTSASDHSGTASRIDGSKRSARSVSRRTLSKSSSSTNPLLAVLARPLTVGNLSRFESPRELMGLSGSGTLKKAPPGTRSSAAASPKPAMGARLGGGAMDYRFPPRVNRGKQQSVVANIEGRA